MSFTVVAGLIGTIFLVGLIAILRATSRK